MKKRNWTTIVYPDSAPEDWIDQLRQSGVDCAISPFHDKDLTAIGEYKKPHYHVILCYPGPTTYKCVQNLSDSILSGVLVKPIESIRGMYRYLTHKDNPEKFQYNDSDIILLNGFEPDNVLSNSDESLIAQCLIDYIKTNNIKYYSELIDTLRHDSSVSPDYIHVAMSKIMLFKTYLESQRYMKKDLIRFTSDNKIIRVDTGEIVGQL